jgi:hypothetical protein
VADLQLEVPQDVQHRLGGALLLGRDGFRRQEHEVEVTVRRHLAAPGAPEADERNAVDG